MRYFYQSIISLFLLSGNANAIGIFIDPLYWKATESVDWELNNNLNEANQNISYKIATFHFKPGIRIGISDDRCGHMRLYYTHYHTNTKDSASGNLTSAFLGGKIDQNDIDPDLDFFYRSGQLNFTINFNMVDWDIGKDIPLTDCALLRPIVGLEAGWINQKINTSFQGQVSLTEKVSNKFAGVGPKVGMESQLILWRRCNYQVGAVANIAASFLWGHWEIKDRLRDTIPRNIVVATSSRNMAAIGLQGLLGVNVTHQNLSASLGYEMSDWYNQCQIFDDATGPHNNNLILQGLTLSFTYKLG